jgi:hypothetical protein
MTLILPLWAYLGALWLALLAGFALGTWWKARFTEVQHLGGELTPMQIRTGTDIRQPWQRLTPPAPGKGGSVWLKPPPRKP